MPTESTREEIDHARQNVTECLEWADIYDDNKRAIRVLLAATAPIEPSTDPRPADMAELARLTAIELRKRGTWAHSTDFVLWTPFITKDGRPKNRPTSIAASEFDNLGPIGCADHIQAEESRRAQEWAGDV